MKKKTKIIVMILSSIIILAGILLLLIFNTNLFLDTSDLVCIRDDSNFTIDIKEESRYVFKFDNKGVIISYIEERFSTYSSEIEAQEYYDYLKNNYNNEVKIDGKKVSTSKKYDVIENEGYYGKSKKELKEYYETKFNYSCE